METTREIALRTYKEATAHGMMDTPMNWHIWKRAFDTAERELKNLQLGAVSGMCEHPWASVMGDGEMKPAKCLKCGQYL